MSNFYLLKAEARDEIYVYIDTHIRKLPKNSKGGFDEFSGEFVNNDIDALRHAYVSGVYTIEFGEDIAELLGRLNELCAPSSGNERENEENMDLWNNCIGRKYGRMSKSKEDLIENLIRALKNGELILDPKDQRKYDGKKILKRKPKGLVIPIKQSVTGENLLFFDFAKKDTMTKEEFITAIKNGDYPHYCIKTIHEKETPVSKRDRYSFNNLG